MRSIKIEDKKILKLLEEKQAMANKNLDILKKLEELEAEFNTNTGKVKRLDEKVRPLILKLIKDVPMEEYDELSKVSVTTDGCFLEIVNRLEEFKNMFANRK